MKEPHLGKFLRTEINKVFPGPNLALTINGGHQAFYCLNGGDSRLTEKVNIWCVEENTPPRGKLVASMRGGWNESTPWRELEPKMDTHTYTVRGVHFRKEMWWSNKGFHLVADRHENGILYRINYEDCGEREQGDGFDYNDMMVRFAVVWDRTGWYRLQEGEEIGEDDVSIKIEAEDIFPEVFIEELKQSAEMELQEEGGEYEFPEENREKVKQEYTDDGIELLGD